jgi:uncharacterized protein YcbK (DUF882 family)
VKDQVKVCKARPFVNEISKLLLMVLSTIALVTSISLNAAHAETRSLKLYNTHTKETAEIIFKQNGRYDRAGLKKLNTFMRDWRANKETKMDPELFDFVWAVYQKAETDKPIHVVSGYRSSKTNNMLRRRSGGAARTSQHTYGKALDFYIPGVSTKKLRNIALKMQVGGVGYYPTSGTPFVHLDTGGVRYWPRISRTELASLFPDGKTLYLPADGKPLSGYQLAKAAEKKGKLDTLDTSRTLLASADTPRFYDDRPARLQTNSSDDDEAESGNLFAALFGGGEKNQDKTTASGKQYLTAAAPSLSFENITPPVPLSIPAAKVPEATRLASQQPVSLPPLPQTNPLIETANIAPQNLTIASGPAIQDGGTTTTDREVNTPPVQPSNPLQLASVADLPAPVSYASPATHSRYAMGYTSQQGIVEQAELANLIASTTPAQQLKPSYLPFEDIASRQGNVREAGQERYLIQNASLQKSEPIKNVKQPLSLWPSQNHTITSHQKPVPSAYIPPAAIPNTLETPSDRNGLAGSTPYPKPLSADASITTSSIGKTKIALLKPDFSQPLPEAIEKPEILSSFQKTGSMSAPDATAFKGSAVRKQITMASNRFVK